MADKLGTSGLLPEDQSNTFGPYLRFDLRGLRTKYPEIAAEFTSDGQTGERFSPDAFLSWGKWNEKSEAERVALWQGRGKKG